jgi:hypothetical protein
LTSFHTLVAAVAVLNWMRPSHFQILPAGADNNNMDANVRTGGNFLEIEWDSPDIYKNPYFLQSYLQTNYNILTCLSFPTKLTHFVRLAVSDAKLE